MKKIRIISKSMKAKLLFCFLLLPMVVTGHNEKTKLTIQDKQQPIERVTFMGYVGNRFKQSYNNRILAQNVDRLVEPFYHRNETHLWQSEFWGKWMNSAVLAYQYLPTDAMLNQIKEAMNKLIETYYNQRPSLARVSYYLALEIPMHSMFYNPKFLVDSQTSNLALPM